MDPLFIPAKLFKFFLMPPGLFVTLMLVAAFWSKRVKRVFFLSMACMSYMISIPWTTYMIKSDTYHETENSFVYGKADDPFIAVVVLGGGVFPDSPSFLLPPEAFRRLMYGSVLAKEKGVPLIVSGKGLNRITESDASRQSLKRIYGDRLQDIYYEDQSLNTTENAMLTAKLVHRMNLKEGPVALVTSGWHIKRAYEAFKAVNMSVIPMPTDYPKEINQEPEISYIPHWLDFLPTIRALKNNHDILHEFFGRLANQIRIGLGIAV